MNYLLKIDPYTETVSWIPFTDSFSALNRTVGGRSLMRLNDHPNHDCLLLSEDGTVKPYPPAFSFGGGDEIYFGTALWVNISEDGELRTPLLSLEEVTGQVEFLGFVNSHVCLKTIEIIDEESGDEGESYVDDHDDDDEYF